MFRTDQAIQVGGHVSMSAFVCIYIHSIHAHGQICAHVHIMFTRRAIVRGAGRADMLDGATAPYAPIFLWRHPPTASVFLSPIWLSKSLLQYV